MSEIRDAASTFYLMGSYRDCILVADYNLGGFYVAHLSQTCWPFNPGIKGTGTDLKYGSLNAWTIHHGPPSRSRDLSDGVE